MVSPAVIVERWDFFLMGIDSLLTFQLERLQRKKATKAELISCPSDAHAPVWLVVLGVRLIIEVGRFPAVSALAAHWHTQLTCMGTSLHPCIHLFAAQKKHLHCHLSKMQLTSPLWSKMWFALPFLQSPAKYHLHCPLCKMLFAFPLLRKIRLTVLWKN